MQLFALLLLEYIFCISSLLLHFYLIPLPIFFSLQILEKTTGPGMPLSKESLAEAKLRLEALDKKDAERRRTAELKNNLEEYIYATKEKVWFLFFY